jgi:hypothetical protein
MPANYQRAHPVRNRKTMKTSGTTAFQLAPLTMAAMQEQNQ